MNNIKAVIKALKSEKIKERQEALSSLKTAFSDDRVVANFGRAVDGTAENRNWLALYQGLFQAVRTERELFKKARLKTTKGSSEATVTRRLEDVAKTIRWFVERTMEVLGSKVLAAIYSHLTGMLAVERELFRPVALDYLKALKHIASHRPHLDHMDDLTWIKCVEISFNVILCDSLRSGLEGEESDANEVASNDEQGSDGSDNDSLPSRSNPRKRGPPEGKGRDFLPSKSLASSKPAFRRQQISVSSEQVECASLLTILLRSTNSPINSPSHSYLPSAILTRLRRFINMYPSESSLLHDYLTSVSSTLDHLALNSVQDVRCFAQGTWNSLVDLWGVKDRRLKEELLIVLRILLAFIIAEEPVPGALDQGFSVVEGLSRLWSVLDGEAENRWGVNGLNINSIRLELMETDNPSSGDIGDNPFVATTFRSGWNFDSGQALSWAILELHADCGKELFKLSENTHGITPRSQAKGKRIKLQNPIAALVNSIHTQPASHIRGYHLQVLLFFIDRHWAVLHDTLKHDIVNTLLQFVTFEDVDIQPWIFINLAAVAFSEKFWMEKNPDLLTASQQVEVLNAKTWDTVWAHAVRRANVPGLCRAACHAAHALLVSLFRFTPPSGHIFLTSQQVLLDIESIGKDLDVQGPSYPFDSVCMFLSKCLRIAAQDVRLYRMQLEDKVSKWLAEAWTVTGATRDTVLLSTVSDVLILLETISGFSKQSDLTSRAALPISPIVESMKMEKRSSVIRDFLLFARLPSFNQSIPASSSASLTTREAEPLPLTPSNDDIRLEPRPRERKISSLLQRMLDALTVEWDVRTSNGGHPSIEVARQALDFTITAIAFECTLTINSTLSNRRVLQSAGKLLASIISFTKTSRWTLTEKVLLVLGIEPLVSASCPAGNISWDGVAPPDYANDGMMRSSLPRNEGEHSEMLQRRRGALLRAIWQSNDLQSSLKQLTSTIRSIIDAASQSSQDSTGQVMDVDDQDGFGPIRTTASHPTTTTDVLLDDSGLLHQLYEVYLPILSRGPLLQSSSGQSTRDRLLIERITTAADKNPRWFIMVAPILFREFESGALECNFKQLYELLGAFGELLQLHAYSRSHAVQGASIYLLHATLSLWAAQNTLSDEDTNACISQILAWLCKTVNESSMKTWKSRDAFVQFLEKYVTIDPSELAWQKENERYKPMKLLRKCITDQDIRVRFRTAVALPRVFVTSRTNTRDLMHVYTEIKDSFSQELEHYEQMATRFLTLANVMVVSSAVRRGPYWHLLETCHHSSNYSRHIEAALNSVVERLGMPSLSSLFEAYAFQLAYSMIVNEADFLAFPPRLLGYRDRGSCAEAAFRAFVPTYTIVGALSQYENHCKVLQKDPVDGQKEWVGDIVGFFVAGWYDAKPNGDDDEMEAELRKMFIDKSTFDEDVASNVDSIVASMFRTLGDQDYSAASPINTAICSADPSGKSGQVFAILTRYRQLYPFETHKPNLPTFGASSLISALTWLSKRVDAFGKATIYHVMHELFAGIQRTPLINEKYRLLNSLCMWIALRNEDFADATLLHTLLHGATSLLGQRDLARSAQSILEWTFRTYRKLKVADGRLSRVLVRISAICHDYSSRAANPVSLRIGRDLSTWIDEQTLSLSQIPVLNPLIMKALPAWPRDPSKELADSCSDVKLETLSEVLRDEHISSNKFRIVRRLKEYLSHDEIDFGRRTFWRLKECIPHTQKLHEEDTISFTDLLMHNHGRINSLTAEQTTSRSIRARHCRLTKKTGARGEEFITDDRDAIIFGLLTLLEDESPALVHTAYNTLRLMMAVLPSAVGQLQMWPPEYRMEVDFLQTYPRRYLRRPSRNLSILLSSEYYVEMSTKFPQWISHLAVLIADIMASRDASFGQLYSILSADVSTAEQVLPVLILSLLQSEQSEKPVEAKWESIISEYFTQILTFPSSSIPTVRCIVEVVLHLRYFPLRKEEPLASDHWLNLDFLLLAKNSVRCGAYTTALLFLELAADDGTFSGIDSDVAEQIQYEIYAHIDEPDGFYGIQTQNLHQFLIQRLHHEKQWDKAFRFHGAMLEAHSSSPTSEDASGLLQSFHAFGFNQLAIKTLQLSDTWAVSNDTSGTAMSYKLGWRSETWDLPDRDTYSTGAPLYNALRAIYRERDSKMVDSILRHSFYKEIDQLRSLGIESIAEIRDVLQSLMCLNQILSWKNAAVQQNQQGKSIDFSKWDDFTSISSEFEFSDLENIMSSRIALVRSIRQREERQIGNIVSPFVQSLLELEKRCLLSLSQAAREGDQTQIALNSILRARNLGVTPSAEISQEYANVLWSMNEPKLAVTYLNEMLKEPQVDSNHLKANILSKLGTWTSEACLEKPTEIWEKYFIPAKRALESHSSNPSSNAAEVYHQCAEFADKQYHALSKSSDMIRRKVYIDRKTQEIEQREKQLTQLSGSKGDIERERLHDVSRAQNDARKLLAADKEQHKKQKAARDEFLKQALDMYSQSLCLSDVFDSDAPIKFSSLWFANFDDEIIKQKTIHSALDRVPSRKFIFLAHQLAARITKAPGSNQGKNQNQLQRLVIRLCQEHPFHSLYQVYCLQADTVNIEVSQRQSGRHSQSPPESQTDRSSAAGDVLARLREDAAVGARVQDVERTCLAYLQWAKYALKTQNGQTKFRTGVSQQIPGSMLILSLSQVKVPVLTADTKVDPTMQYNDCVWIQKYQNKFDTAGGVNLPKICVCYGSDGGKYKQLFKGEGKDDMRQDAVMEQVFELVNKVLAADRETCRRTLQVRSYKVVPLGTQAGVLEFVTNTSPLREWLLRGHSLYRPSDIEHKDASSRLSKAQNSSTEERVKVYSYVRSKFLPVFRHYFTEKHKNPMAWFGTRLRYTRSVATTSIVGHILGLGDRHTSNILMDNATGEVVHIDLGIAFDQGKLLPIPELVPFRLTRDIVDGMGVSGTQGVFQRCAEETLRVLREGSDIIMTVLEVFKYDPLHSWTASEVKIRQAQQDVPVVTPINEASRFNFGIGIDMNSGTAEEAADRALTSVARKLDKSLSVESTVNELIAEATDIQNLAVIFQGWGPHL